MVIHNAENRGFAAGCNQALAKARGEYLVFLNNDTIVTPGWLNGLVRWTLSDWPHVGLVGPVSNYAPAPQWVEPGYRELAGLDSFAESRRLIHAGKGLQVERLTGFCLLARREMLQQVGGFDEGYGLGFFEDDDLCLRVRQAGYKLLVAEEVYIHHFGSRTFGNLGLDASRQLRENFERFRAKWGTEQTAGYRMPVVERAARPRSVSALGQPALPGQARPRVALTMIVKNEEANLPGCLESVADLVDEIVIVDTGSTDQTRALARQFGARVIDFPWVDSFAAARNESLRHASAEWILWMDADDRLDEDNRTKVKELFGRLGEGPLAYAFKCRCLPDPDTGVATVVDHVRLFRRLPEVRWRYRVHEQILPAIRQCGGQVQSADIVIQHTGYQDRAVRARKQQRDLRLLEMGLAEHPDDPFILFNLGWSYAQLGEPAKALPFLRRRLAHSAPPDSIVRKLYVLIVDCHRSLGQYGDALAACQEGRTHHPQDAEIVYLQALVLRDMGKQSDAEACFIELLTGAETAHFASVAEGLRGHAARHSLAVLYCEQGREVEAEAQWRAATAEAPDYARAWLGLGDLYVRQKRGRELEEVLANLDNGVAHTAGTKVLAAVLRARGCLARQDHVSTRRILGEVLQQAPDNAPAWETLGHSLLQEGQDWEGAERALRRVLELEPNNARARHFLEMLMRQMDKVPAGVAAGSAQRT